MNRFVTKVSTKEGTFVMGGSGSKNIMKKNILNLEASGISKRNIEIIPVRNDKTILGFVVATVIGIGIGLGLSLLFKKDKKDENKK